MWGVLCKILSVLHNIVMDMNNVMGYVHFFKFFYGVVMDGSSDSGSYDFDELTIHP